MVFVIQDFAYEDPKLEFNVDAPNGLVMEGYLFKRASNAFKTWNRLVEVQNNYMFTFYLSLELFSF